MLNNFKVSLYSAEDETCLMNIKRHFLRPCLIPFVINPIKLNSLMVFSLVIDKAVFTCEH